MEKLAPPQPGRKGTPWRALAPQRSRVGTSRSKVNAENEKSKNELVPPPRLLYEDLLKHTPPARHGRDNDLRRKGAFQITPKGLNTGPEDVLDQVFRVHGPQICKHRRDPRTSRPEVNVADDPGQAPSQTGPQRALTARLSEVGSFAPRQPGREFTPWRTSTPQRSRVHTSRSKVNARSEEENDDYLLAHTPPANHGPVTCGCSGFTGKSPKTLNLDVDNVFVVHREQYFTRTSDHPVPMPEEHLADDPASAPSQSLPGKTLAAELSEAVHIEDEKWRRYRRIYRYQELTAKLERLVYLKFQNEDSNLRNILALSSDWWVKVDQHWALSYKQNPS
ncbi:hypothetical protein Hypma_008130, partial [Hypsizygus marmoreus]